jgi:hypothetical protein
VINESKWRSGGNHKKCSEVRFNEVKSNEVKAGKGR